MTALRTFEDLWLAGCAGKAIYSSVPAAEAHILYLLKQSNFEPRRALHAYQCSFDRTHIHIGGYEEERKVHSEIVRRGRRVKR